jgi:hypothetical protein
MASTFHFFRDSLQINLNTIRALNAPGGATMVFGARSIQLTVDCIAFSPQVAAARITIPARIDVVVPTATVERVVA